MNRIERMANVCDVKRNQVKKELQYVKDFQPRMAELAKTIDAAKQYGLKVSQYTEHPSIGDITYFGNGCYKYKYKDGYDSEYFVDVDGMVFTSDYSRKYDNGKTIFSDTFKLGVGSTGERNEERINRLHNLQVAFVNFEKKAYEDIDRQLDKLEREK